LPLLKWHSQENQSLWFRPTSIWADSLPAVWAGPIPAKKETIGGLARNFYHRVYNHYQQDEAWKWMKKEEYGNTGQGTPAIDGDMRTMWIFEPHIAEQVFEELVQENNIQLYRDEWLDRENGVEKSNGKITSITTLSGKTFKGKCLWMPPTKAICWQLQV
jgi:hypothetical protein